MKILEAILEAFILMLGVAIGLSITWIVIVGLIRLICLCFSIAFSPIQATGIWQSVCEKAYGLKKVK